MHSLVGLSVFEAVWEQAKCLKRQNLSSTGAESVMWIPRTLLADAHSTRCLLDLPRLDTGAVALDGLNHEGVVVAELRKYGFCC